MRICNHCSALTKRFIGPSLPSCKVFSSSKNKQQAFETTVSQSYHVCRNSNKMGVVVTNSVEYFQHPYNFPENSVTEFCIKYKILLNTVQRKVRMRRKFRAGTVSNKGRMRRICRVGAFSKKNRMKRN